MTANRSLLGWVAALLLLPACITNTPPSTFQELGPEANTKGFGELYPPDETEGAFTFGIGDTVGILVQNNPDLSGPQTIRMDGKITLPVVGDVMAAGLTPEQLKQKLESKIAVYMKDLQITVTPVSTPSKKFYVAAINPLVGGFIVRALPYRGDLTLFEVWATIGSPSSSLDDDAHIKVIRADPRHPVVKIVNIREMLMCGYSGGNVQIKPNDIVYVPPTLWGRVNQMTTAIAAPFTGLFALTGAYYRVDSMVRIVTGNTQGGGFGAGYFYGGGGGLGGGGFGGNNPPPGTLP
jgi:polysaccharide export outer membrane protein